LRIILAQYYKVSIIIPSTRSALPPGLSQNPRGIPQPRIASPRIAIGLKTYFSKFENEH
jgi:hypothetical protein